MMKVKLLAIALVIIFLLALVSWAADGKVTRDENVITYSWVFESTNGYAIRLWFTVDFSDAGSIATGCRKNTEIRVTATGTAGPVISSLKTRVRESFRRWLFPS
jgi:hypothetical protein